LVVDLERVDLAGGAAVFLVAFVADLRGDFFAAARVLAAAFFDETFRAAVLADAVTLRAEACFAAALVFALVEALAFDRVVLADLPVAVALALVLVAAAFFALRRTVVGVALAGLEAVADFGDLRDPAFRAIGVGKRSSPLGNKRITASKKRLSNITANLETVKRFFVLTG